MLQEFRTPAGYFIVVDDEKFTCGVFRGQMENITPELVQSTGLRVAGVVFLGEDVRPALAADGFVLIPVRGGSLSVPYFINESPGKESEKKGIQLAVKVLTDQFPVHLSHFADVRGFLRELGEKEKRIFTIVMIGSGVPRIDAMGVRVALPSARIFQARPRSESAGPTLKSRVRAADLVEQPGMEFVSRNPVYMARVLLRRFDFSGMERIPIDFDLSAQDMEFIQTFLDIMLKNDTGSPELDRNRGKIQDLARFFRLVDRVLHRDQSVLDSELKGGLPEGMAQKLLPFLQKQRKRAGSREEEISLWEMEYRIRGRPEE